MADALIIYRYIEGASDPVQDFIGTLTSNDRARLHVKIAVLRANGFLLLGSNLLTDTNKAHIKEIVVNGRVAVRKLCCRGPIEGNKELTLLFGCKEKNSKYVPKNSLDIAEYCRER